MIDDKLDKRFGHKELIILGGTLNKEKVRQSHVRAVNSISRCFRGCCI